MFEVASIIALAFLCLAYLYMRFVFPVWIKKKRERENSLVISDDEIEKTTKGLGCILLGFASISFATVAIFYFLVTAEYRVI